MKKLLVVLATLTLPLAACTDDPTVAQPPAASELPEPSESPTQTPTESIPSEPAPEVTDPGTTATVGSTIKWSNWSVKIDDINLDADDEIEEAGDPLDQTPDGRWVLVTYTATYTGDEASAAPEVMINWAFEPTVGESIRSAIAILTPIQVENLEREPVPELAPGESLELDVAFDVPVDSIEGGKIWVGDQVADDEFLIATS